MQYYLSGFLTFVLIVISTASYGQSYGQNGMVVSDNVLASEVGVEILKKGGNAIDATIATAFALAVTHPQAGNLGGGGFLVFLNSDGEATTIDFRETAPLAASPEMFQDSSGNLIPGANHKFLMSIEHE